jgi:hypothetical protein
MMTKKTKKTTPGRSSVLGLAKSGAPITENLADEAERGYDLDLGRRVGRRSLAGGPGPSPRVNFRVTAELYESARDRAEREGKTVSEVARDALAAYVGD